MRVYTHILRWMLQVSTRRWSCISVVCQSRWRGSLSFFHSVDGRTSRGKKSEKRIGVSLRILSLLPLHPKTLPTRVHTCASAATCLFMYVYLLMTLRVLFHPLTVSDKKSKQMSSLCTSQPQQVIVYLPNCLHA